jgi:hypothetical protein
MTGGSAARVGLRAVFAQPGYRRLWSARTTSQAGDVFATVALALLMFDARDECRGPAKFGRPTWTENVAAAAPVTSSSWLTVASSRFDWPLTPGTSFSRMVPHLRSA